MSSPVRSSCLCTSSVLLRAGAAVCATCGAPLVVDATAQPFSQRDGERPPGCGKPKYLRTHARALAAGDAGAWSEGRSRLFSPEAWAKWARTEAPRTPPVVAVMDDVLADLGARRAS